MEVLLSVNKKFYEINSFKYGFKKKLSENIKRWNCTKINCKLFLKTNSFQNFKFKLNVVKNKNYYHFILSVEILYMIYYILLS